MLGEIFALGVVLMWSGSAICFDFVNQRIVSTQANLVRFFFGFLFITFLLFCISGDFLFAHADWETIAWIASAGVVGLVFGDYFLFAAYRLIHASYAQLIMTLSPLFASLAGFFILQETLSWKILLGMFVTLSGIALTIVKRERNHDDSANNLHLSISGKGILFAVLSALGQGIGLFLSKKGIQVYLDVAGITATDFYISIAATQIRVITGFICFVLIVLCSRHGFTALFQSVQKSKVMGLTCLGALFGLGIGVPLSLLALQYTQTAVVSTIIATTPIVILIYQRIFHKRPIALIEISGIILSVIGVAIMVFK